MIAPSVPIRRYLYEKLVPAGMLIVPDHRGLVLVYCAASSEMALLVSQLPSCDIEPTTCIVSPHAVSESSLKVTSTLLVCRRARDLWRMVTGREGVNGVACRAVPACCNFSGMTEAAANANRLKMEE